MAHTSVNTLLLSTGSVDRLPIPSGPRTRTAALAGGAVLLWATWPALASLTGALPPFLTFGLAGAVGFAAALAVACARGEARAFFRTPPRAVAVVGLGLLANNVLFLHAVPRIGASEANVLVYLWPVMLVLISARERGERLGAVRLGGIAIAFTGVTVAIGPSFAAGADWIGIAAAALGGLAFAIMAAVRAHGREAHDVVGPSMGLVAVLALSAHALFEVPAVPTAGQAMTIAAIGIVPITLANALWDRATRGGFASMISSIAYLTPIAALGVLALVGMGTITPATALGATLVVLGALAASDLLPGRLGR